MTIPKYFNDLKMALFDSKRNQDHLKGVVDLGYNGKDTDATDLEKVKNNLAITYRHLVTNATDPTMFFGGEYRAGIESISGGGSVEQIPHTPVHRWVGDPRETNDENLGNFYSAGRDTLFYCHHSNVDRMWSLWKMLGGYNYQRVDVPWLKSKPVPRVPRSGVAKKVTEKVKKTNDVTFPVKLDKIVKVLVLRPKKSRSKKEKGELLIVQGITYDSEKYVKFDVYVNDEDDDEETTPDQTEFAGSFAQLPHKHKGKSSSKTNFRAGLAELLEELEADNDDNVFVMIVPWSGSDDITIGAINIIYA
ncbi:polyphenol oxidase I, chloroplastic-like protein [Tanacetum coccineum]